MFELEFALFGLSVKPIFIASLWKVKHYYRLFGAVTDSLCIANIPPIILFGLYICWLTTLESNTAQKYAVSPNLSQGWLFLLPTPNLKTKHGPSKNDSIIFIFLLNISLIHSTTEFWITTTESTHTKRELSLRDNDLKSLHCDKMTWRKVCGLRCNLCGVAHVCVFFIFVGLSCTADKPFATTLQTNIH